MNNDTAGHDWAMPGSAGEPSVVAPSDAPPPSPGTIPNAVHQYASAPVAVTTAAPQQAAAPTFRSWQPGIIPLRPVGFGEFLAVPFKAMRFNRAVVVGGPLLCVAASTLLLAAAMWLAFTDPSLALMSPTSQFQGVQASTVIVGILAVLSIVLADALSCALLTPGVARATLGERITVSEALRTLRPRLGHVMLLWLITGVAGLLSLMPGLALVAIGASSDNDGMFALGFFAMFALGLIFGVPVYIISVVARCVVVLERTGAVASIRRTVRLIRGRFWWSVLIIGVTAILIYIVTAVLQQLLSFIGTIALAIGMTGEWLGVAIFVAVLVIGMVVSYVFTYAYMGSVYALVYIDARIRHEGFDLELARAAEARRG